MFLFNLEADTHTHTFVMQHAPDSMHFSARSDVAAVAANTIRHRTIDRLLANNHNRFVRGVSLRQ